MRIKLEAQIHKVRNKKGGFRVFPNIDAEQARAKINNTKLAQMLHIDRKTLSKWKRDGLIPASALIKMSEIFKCSTDYLLGRTNMTENNLS